MIRCALSAVAMAVLGFVSPALHACSSYAVAAFVCC